MSDVAEESIASGERERMREEEVDDEVSEDEEDDDDEETAGEEERRPESTAASLSSLLSSPSTRGSESVRGGKGRRHRPVRSHALVELTSLDELSLPTNAARSIKYTCIAASRRLLVLGTSTGSVYVFARYASRQRAATAASGGGRLNAVPLHVYTTKDGALHTVRISPSEQLIAVGGESGRVSVLSLAAGVGGGGAAASGASTAAAAPSSPASALIHTVPGDARSPDRVNCLCWSTDSSLLYAAHASGLVVQHKVGIRRSVFRSPFEEKLRLEGSAVQMEYAAGATAAAAARLLISTPEASFVYDLQASKVYQVGKKPRNAPMGACWMRGEGGSATDDFVLAARQNGRIWEASTTGIVYKTHQLRQSSSIPTLDSLSFRPPDAAAAPPSSFLQQASIDTELARTTVHLGTLAPITADSAPPPSDGLSLPSTSSTTTSFASTVSSSVSSSTATVSSEAGTRLVCSAVRSTLFVADIDRSQLVVVSDLGYLIRDWAVCGSDVFVLFAGSGSSFASGGSGLRKYTLFPVERAAERLLARKAVLQAARLVLSVRPPESTVDATPRDTVAAGWPMPLIEKIQTALAAIKKKESESLRRQLNDLVCGGDRKPSIGEEDVVAVGASLSSLSVARTRRVSTSDRYLDRRRVEGAEEEEGAESEYEDGEGGVIRRERGRRKRRDDDERSRSSPDNLRPLARPTAASAAKVRAASPRSEDRRVRREELKRAKRLLESDTSHLQTEHRDSLRTLLELGSPPPIQFKHSVTVASVARNLAELARVAPPSITDLLVERRTSVKPSSSSSGKRGGGARVVKAIRPQRPTSGGAGGGSRKSGGGGGGAMVEEEERNSNVLVVDGTKKTSGSIVVDEEDSENNVEWRKEKRMGGVFLREEGGALTRATATAPQETATAADAAAAAAAEQKNQRCERCGLHKSWLAVFLFGVAVHRVSVVVREGEYGRDGVPCTVDEWVDALDEVACRTEERRRGCAKCERAMHKALESVPASGRFCDGLRPVVTRVDAEAMREKVLSLPEEVLRAAVFGVSTERRKGKRSGEKREEKENRGVHQPMSAAAAAAPSTVSAEEGEIENGNGEEREEIEEGEGRQWTAMMDARQVLTAALFALGREGLREMITHRAKRRTLEALSDGDWALLARLLAPRENTGTAIPILMARSMLKEYGMHKFVSIDAPTAAPSSTVPTPPASIRGGGGYGRRVASIDSPQQAREPATISWPMDIAGVCPMCSLALSAVVGGGRATSAAAAAGGEEGKLACYPCGHAYHAICIGEATRRRHVPGPHGISPVCIVCRVRARRSKAAAAAVAAK